MLKLLAFASVLYATSLSAQQVKITWGEESKVELDYNSFVNGLGSDMIKLCFENSGGGMFGGKRTSTPILVRYNDKLAEMSFRKYEVDDKNISFNNLLSVKGKLFLFTSQYDKDSKTTTFYCQPIDITTLNPEGKPINLGSFDAINKSSQSSVGYQLSQDSTKIMMFGLSPFSKKENEKYYLAVYDNNMKKLWDNTVQLPYKDKDVQIFSSLVTNEGKVGVLIKHYDQEVSKERIKKDGNDLPSYKTKFLLYENNNTKPAEFVLDLSDKFVHTLQLTSDDKNNLVLFGLYKSKYNGYVNGYFMSTIDKGTNKVTISKMNAFPQDLVELVKIDKQGSDKEKDPGFGTAFRLAGTLDRADGSKDYLLEYTQEYYVPPSSYYNGSTYVSRPGYWVYNYGDIIDISVKPNGSNVLARIPKMQSSTNIRMYSNFKALPYKDKLLLFYNDERDNVERDLARRPDDLQKFGKSVLTMTTIDTKGNVDRSVILDHKEMKMTTCVRESRILDKNRIGLYAQKGGNMFAAAKDMVGLLEVK